MSDIKKQGKTEPMETNFKANVESETLVAKTDSTVNYDLPEKVIIKPVRRNTWLPAEHDGSIRYSGTGEYLTVQAARSTGILNTGLTARDEARLEKAFNFTPGRLSRYNKEYWSKFHFQVSRNGLTINPRENPKDELIYRVALVHTEIANSEKDRAYNAFARYVMQTDEQESAEINKILNVKMDAFAEFTKMSESDMIDFLKVYGKDPGKNPKIEFLRSTVGKVVDEDPELFLNTVKAQTYKMRIFIQDCIQNNVLRRTTNKYELPGGEILGYTETQVVDFLQNPSNREIVVNIKGQLEMAKK